MTLKFLAFLIFFFVLLPLGWLRRAAGLSRFTTGAGARSTWDVRRKPAGTAAVDLHRRQPQRP